MSRFSILLVDDEPHVRRVIRLALEREGYAVDEAGNGEQALDKMATTFPRVLITDLSMPKMDGRTLVEAVKRLYADADLPILIMTSMTEREERSWVCKLQGVQFFEKPISTRRLLTYLGSYRASLDEGKAVTNA